MKVKRRGYMYTTGAKNESKCGWKFIECIPVER
jgi:hypothetical protein